MALNGLECQVGAESGRGRSPALVRKCRCGACRYELSHQGRAKDGSTAVPQSWPSAGGRTVVAPATPFLSSARTRAASEKKASKNPRTTPGLRLSSAVNDTERLLRPRAWWRDLQAELKTWPSCQWTREMESIGRRPSTARTRE
jgi:hypothetical protein